MEAAKHHQAQLQHRKALSAVFVNWVRLDQAWQLTDEQGSPSPPIMPIR